MKKVLSLTNINTLHHEMYNIKKSISTSALPNCNYIDYIKQPIEIMNITHFSINKLNKCFAADYNNFPNEILDCIVAPNELSSETEKIESINIDDIFKLDDINPDDNILIKKVLKLKKRKL